MTKPFSILLVDDQQDFLDPIAFWLEAKGYAVKIAHHGQEALEKLKEEIPNIVFLDVNMPVMNGIETLKQIRKDYAGLPVIMITAELDKIDTLQEIGISGFFPKSGSLEHLAQLLDPIIRMHIKMKPPPKP